MRFENSLNALEELSDKFALVKQFKGAKEETNLELATIIKDLIVDLALFIDLLENYKTLHNWKYCNNNKKLIEGQIFKKEKPVLICDEVLEIDFDKKIVRTVNMVFRLGKELS